MLEFINSIGTFNLMLIIFVFIIFLVLMRKVIKTVINIVWISAASALFPLVLNFLGFSVPLKLDTILFFLILGLGLYFIYILGKIIYTMLGIVEKSARVVTYPFRGKDKDLEKRVEKVIEEREKKDKEGRSS